MKVNHTTSLLFSLSRTVGSGVALLFTISSVFILVPKAFHLDQRHDSLQDDFSSLVCSAAHTASVRFWVTLSFLPVSSPCFGPSSASHLGLVAASPMVSIDIFLYLHNCTVSTDCCVLFICKTKLQELGCAWFF